MCVFLSTPREWDASAFKKRLNSSIQLSSSLMTVWQAHVFQVLIPAGIGFRVGQFSVVFTTSAWEKWTGQKYPIWKAFQRKLDKVTGGQVKG